MLNGIIEACHKLIQGIEGEYMKTAEINAVYSEEMGEFLESLGVLEDVIEGRKVCYFCGNHVKVKDVQSVFPYENDVQICCNSFHCYKLFMDMVND